jgi:hypothetical protein
MRALLAIAMAAALSACATAEPADPQASLQNTIYIAGDHSAPVQPTALPEVQPADPNTADDSTLKRLYWFLAGR